MVILLLRNWGEMKRTGTKICEWLYPCVKKKKMIAYRTLVCNGNGISAKIEVTLIDDIWLGPVKPPRRCLSWVGIFMLEISPCGYGSTNVVTPPLSGDLQVEILIQILIIQVCNPRKYEAIVTVNWWVLDYEGCSILKISWVRAVFLIVPDVVTRHNRSVKKWITMLK